ncbi:hypothetical protein [Thermodesulfitimonas sp.]
MEQVLQHILEELRELRQGQDELRQGQDELRRVQEVHAHRLERLEQGLGRQVLRLERIENRLNNLEKGQENLQTQITQLEVRLETEAFDKIRILFDAFQLHRDYFEEIRASLRNIEERLSVYDR